MFDHECELLKAFKQNKCKLSLNTTLSLSNHQLHVSAKNHFQTEHIIILVVGNIYYIVMNVVDEIYYECVLRLKMDFIVETCC
jgi:hypothetical protein